MYLENEITELKQDLLPDRIDPLILFLSKYKLYE